MEFKCVLIEGAGGYDKLKQITIPNFEEATKKDFGKSISLVVGPGDVLIRTHAVGVNYADVCVRMGLYASAKKYVGWPICPGFEFSGTVLEIGSGDDEESERKFKEKGIKVGSKVFGVTRFGGYATHVVVPNLEEAASFPAVWLTAYYAMFELAHVRKKETILVHSAAGGVGSALVQLGKTANCRVVAVVGSSHKVETCKRMGADLVIDKSKENLWKICEQYYPDGFDVIFDANETLGPSYNHLSAGGRLVVYGFHTMLPKSGGKPNWLKLIWDWIWTPRFNPLDMTSANKSVLAFNLSFLFHRVEKFESIFLELMRLVETEQIHSPKITTYHLEQVVEAHKDLESGKTIGKLVLLT